MSDELLLFLVLAAIYFTDCFLWLGKDSVAFVSWLGFQWHEKRASPFFQTSRGGILLLNPFPPLGRVLCTDLPPLSMSPLGICPVNSQLLTPLRLHDGDPFIPFKEIHSIGTQGSELFINDSKVCTFRRQRDARRITELLNALLNSTEAARESMIREYWSSHFDFERPKKIVEKVWERTGSLRLLCNALFVYLFIVSPMFVVYMGMGDLLVPLAVGMFIIGTVVCAVFYRLHREFCPEAREERITNLIKMLLCPPVSVRARDLITAYLMNTTNPLVLAHLLFTDERFKGFAERTLRNLKYSPVGCVTDVRCRAVCEWQNQILFEIALEYLGHRTGIQKEFLRAPERDDPGNVAYCPRCLCQFIAEEGDCPDCPGVKRAPLPPLCPTRELGKQ